MNSANKLITENLKRWMEATPALSSQTAVARAAKVGQSHISRIYRGNANPTVDIIEAIAKAFKRKPADLFTDATSDDAQSAQTAAAANDAATRQYQALQAEESLLLDGYRAATTEDRETMIFLADRAIRNFHERTGT